MKLLRLTSLAAALVLGSAFLAACSSSDSDPMPMGDGGADDTGVAALKAPTLDMVMKMDGVLHLMWTNHQDDCDAVEVERKSAQANGTEVAAYAVLYSVAGDVDNKMDAQATEDLTYSYRLHCKKGDMYSPYSNELSENPK